MGIPALSYTSVVFFHHQPRHNPFAYSFKIR